MIANSGGVVLSEVADGICTTHKNINMTWILYIYIFILQATKNDDAVYFEMQVKI